LGTVVAPVPIPSYLSTGGLLYFEQIRVRRCSARSGASAFSFRQPAMSNVAAAATVRRRSHLSAAQTTSPTPMTASCRSLRETLITRSSAAVAEKSKQCDIHRHKNLRGTRDTGTPTFGLEVPLAA